jgi:hypothetical protein
VTQEPQSVYETRVEARRAELRLLEERDRRLSLARAIAAKHEPIQMTAFASSAWYFVQAITVILLFLALYEYFTKRRYVVIGLLYAAVFASRFTAGLTIIFFLLALLKEKKPSIITI